MKQSRNLPCCRSRVVRGKTKRPQRRAAGSFLESIQESEKKKVEIMEKLYILKQEKWAEEKRVQQERWAEEKRIMNERWELEKAKLRRDLNLD